MPEDMPPPQAAAATEHFVDGYLLYLLAAVSHGASGQFHAHVRKQGLKVPEWRVLATLHDQDGAMVTTLARISLLEQSRLTKIIDRMESSSLVTRRPDPADARRVRVFLTDTGRKLAERLVKDARAHEAELLQRLPSADAQALKPVLQALLKRLEP